MQNVADHKRKSGRERKIKEKIKKAKSTKDFYKGGVKKQ